MVLRARADGISLAGTVQSSATFGDAGACDRGDWGVDDRRHPGIGPAIAIAILLPATVFLDDLVSLVLLLGVYGSSMYGGAIPAILINTPGTPVNALTTYDGYAMTQRGEAGRGLSLAYSALLRRLLLHSRGACRPCHVWPLSAGSWRAVRSAGHFHGGALGAVLLILAHRQTMVIAALLFGIGFLISLIGRQR